MSAYCRAFVGCIVLVCLAGCHHTPARVEDYSVSHVKRKLTSDGYYRVRRGDTLYAIAFSYGLDHRTVARWNGIPSPYVIYPGQKIRLSPPPHRRTRHRTAAKPPPPAKTSTTVPSGKTARKPSVRAQPPRPAAAPALATDPKSWLWPSKGKILRGYVAGNPARNGLDIAGRQGQPVIATAPGKVVYSGNGLIGYGELIIIKHSERMLSAYAHNRVRLVQEGAQVKAGQKIAEMGRNNENIPLLHFEIRVRGKPVDPLRYLPRK